MMNRQLRALVSAIAIAAGLAACSGGSTGVSFTPAPPSPPPPTPPPPPPPTSVAVELVQSPPAGELAVVGTGDLLRIRYDPAANQYQVSASGADWTALVDDPRFNSNPNVNFVFASRADWPEGSRFTTAAHHQSPAYSSRYRYSNLAEWSLRTAGPFEDQVQGGIIALGVATPQGAVPVTGTGSYSGVIDGVSNVTAASGWGDVPNAPIMGTVSLRFDFASGSLAGEMRPSLACDCDPIDFPTLSFADTVFSVGGRAFSGRFDSGVAGANSFAGLFTGPNAEELIGQWSFPFLHRGAPASAAGAWIAKRGQ